MEKMLTFPGRVEDLSGLYIDLKKALFDIRNVGSGADQTYVYLDPTEEKDPAPFIESWLGKIPPAQSDRRAFKKRQETLLEVAKIVVEKPKPKADPELEPVPVVEFGTDPEGPLEPVPVVDPMLPEEKQKAPNLLKRIWKVIAG